MTEPHPGAPPRRRRWIYAGSVLLLIAIVAAAVVLFEETKVTADASRKAELLHQRLKEAGLPAPPADALRDTFGDDGGATCADPVAALQQAEGLTTGAAGPGHRPVIGDKDIVQGEVLVIATYCPDRLAAFTKHVRTMKFGETVKK